MAIHKNYIIRVGIIAVYVALAFVMFITGRTHTVLIDNHAAENGLYRAINGMTVTLNRLAPSEFFRDDRDMFTIKGQRIKIHVQSFDGSVNYNGTVRIPLSKDAVLISIPRLINGAENALEPFEL
ncbi:MAG: hypothetical protein J6I73_04905 [Treponema sp.]|nr:hypothetical protein [Treponema sp.]